MMMTLINPTLTSEVRGVAAHSSYKKVYSTLLGVQSWVKFCQQEFGKFPRLVGRYYTYLLPTQAK